MAWHPLLTFARGLHPNLPCRLFFFRLVSSRDGVVLNYTARAWNARSPFVPLGINDCAGAGGGTPGVVGGWCDPRTLDDTKTSVDTSATYMASGFLPSHDGHTIHLYASGQPNTHGEWQPGTGPV